MAGFSEEEVEREKLLSLSSEEVTRKTKERIFSDATGERLRQKVIAIDELDQYLARGWTCVQVLETRNTAIVNPPSL